MVETSQNKGVENLAVNLVTNFEELQSEQYNSIEDHYYNHHHDHYSNVYRDSFITTFLLNGIELEGKEVLEAMCGAGAYTGSLILRGAKVSGLDISDKSIRHFKRLWPDCDAFCSSILKTDLPNESFDCVISGGSLHHIQPKINEGIDEIYRLLKPGGYFCFFEPHKGSLPDLVRKLWYKADSYFCDGEESINLEILKKQYSSKFEIKREAFRGNIGYLLVANSMIFRVPPELKNFYSPFLLWVEKQLLPFQTKLLSCFVLSVWQKRGELSNGDCS